MGKTILVEIEEAIVIRANSRRPHRYAIAVIKGRKGKEVFLPGQGQRYELCPSGVHTYLNGKTVRFARAGDRVLVHVFEGKEGLMGLHWTLKKDTS